MVRPSRWMESISLADFRFCFVSDGQANGGQPAFAIAPVRLLAVTSLRGTCRATPLDQTDSGETALARDERRKFRAHRDGARGRRFGDGPVASAGLHPHRECSDFLRSLYRQDRLAGETCDVLPAAMFAAAR